MASCRQFLEQQSKPITAFAVCLGVILNFALLYLHYMPAAKRLYGDERYYVGIANAIAVGKSPHHNSLWPPLYGEWLGSLLGRFKPLLAPQLIQIVLWCLTGLLLLTWAKRLGFSKATCALTAVFYFTSIELMAFSHYFWPECLHAFFLLVALAFLSMRSTWPLFPAGFFLALCLMTKSLMLPAAPLIAAWGIYCGPKGRRVWRALLVLAGVGVALLGVPHYFSGNQTSLFGRSLYFNVWTGLMNESFHDHPSNEAEPAYYQMQRWKLNDADRDKRLRKKIVDALGKRSMARQITIHWRRLFDRHTFLTTQLADGDRATYAFSNTTLTGMIRHATQLHLLFTLMTSAWAMTLMLNRGSPLRLPAFFAAYMVGVYLLIHVTSRYLVQLLPFLYLCGASFLVHAERNSVPKWRWLAAVALSAAIAIAFFG